MKRYHVSKNLFNPESRTTMANLVNGVVDTSQQYSGYYVSDYIRIESTNVSINSARSYGWYDENQNLVSYENKSTSIFRNYSKPNGAVYIRIAFVNADSPPETVLVVDGNYTAQTMPPYEPYGSEWQTKSPPKYGTATETIQSGDTIYADGTAITAYTIKGNTVQSGTPTPSNPITISGVGNKTANLFNINGTWIVSSGDSYTVNGDSITMTVKWYMRQVIDIKPNTDYTISFERSGNLLYAAIYGGTTISAQTAIRTYIDTSSSFNTGEYTQITILFYTGGQGTSTTGTFSNIMLVEGSTVPSEYIPYGYKIPISSGQTALNPIYLTEPLMKIGDTVDSLASSGTVTYNVGWIDLGTLDWETVASGNFHSTTIITDMKLVDNFTKNNAICTDFKEVTPSYVASTDYSFSSCLNLQRTPFVNKTGFEGMTAAQFKAAMSGVIMYYVKAEAATETVTAPSIPTTEGANTITVDTTVQPSEFTATWTGWHDSSVKEYDGSDWQ